LAACNGGTTSTPDDAGAQPIEAGGPSVDASTPDAAPDATLTPFDAGGGVDASNPDGGKATDAGDASSDAMTDAGADVDAAFGPITACGDAGSACCAAPGQTPDPECDDGDETLCKATTCAIAASCGSTSTCEPLTDQSGKSALGFRARRLIMVAPPSLATPAIQNTVITSGVDMNEPQCGEVGTGDLNLLFGVDLTQGTLTAGSAPPCDLSDAGSGSCDPFNKGYCYMHKTIGAFHAVPTTVPLAKALDGTYGTTQPIPTLDIVSYFQGSYFLFPIRDARVSGVKLSAGGNCIGAFNSQALQSDCTDNQINCSKWRTDAALTGYITLEDADASKIQQLNGSLCAVLTGMKDQATGGCPRDAGGKITAKGNYCSTTNAPGGCADSYWFAATFAASAVKIDATAAGQPDCTANP
jgi:hypothetical protein